MKAKEQAETLARKKLEKEKSKSAPPSRFRIANPEEESDDEVENMTYSAKELEIEEKIKNYKAGYRNIDDGPEDEWKEAQKAQQDYTAFRASLDPPFLPKLSWEEYNKNQENVHIGRSMEITR